MLRYFFVLLLLLLHSIRSILCIYVCVCLCVSIYVCVCVIITFFCVYSLCFSWNLFRWLKLTLSVFGCCCHYYCYYFYFFLHIHHLPFRSRCVNDMLDIHAFVEMDRVMKIFRLLCLGPFFLSRCVSYSLFIYLSFNAVVEKHCTCWNNNEYVKNCDCYRFGCVLFLCCYCYLSFVTLYCHMQGQDEIPRLNKKNQQQQHITERENTVTATTTTKKYSKNSNLNKMLSLKQQYKSESLFFCSSLRMVLFYSCSFIDAFSLCVCMYACDRMCHIKWFDDKQVIVVAINSEH